MPAHDADYKGNDWAPKRRLQDDLADCVTWPRIRCNNDIPATEYDDGNQKQKHCDGLSGHITLTTIMEMVIYLNERLAAPLSLALVS